MDLTTIRCEKKKEVSGQYLCVASLAMRVQGEEKEKFQSKVRTRGFACYEGEP